MEVNAMAQDVFVDVLILSFFFKMMNINVGQISQTNSNQTQYIKQMMNEASLS